MIDVINFLEDVESLSFGYNEIIFCKPDELKECQKGFKFDNNGNSLCGLEKGKWKSYWVVIATDNLGDPIFIDETNPKLAVFTAQHGQENWIETKLADSFEKFKQILLNLRAISINRENPVELEKHPISIEESSKFLNEIIENNNIDAWWWETFIENE